MSADKDNLEHIRMYIQKHERYFEALGFQRPGGLPRYYTEQRPEEWPLDLAKVERLKREEQARDRAAAHSDRTASSGMSKEARDLLDRIRSLADQGLTPEQIAGQLRLIEDGVRETCWPWASTPTTRMRKRPRTPRRSGRIATGSRGAPGEAGGSPMEDQTHRYIYEIASPLELGLADYRGQALIVWRHGDDPEAAQVVRIVSPEELSEVLWQAGLLAQPEHEETTP